MVTLFILGAGRVDTTGKSYKEKHHLPERFRGYCYMDDICLLYTSQIRTIVDLGGIAVLYAHLIQCGELRVRRELEAVQNVLQNQYVQYKQSRESIDLINYKYHDLKPVSYTHLSVFLLQRMYQFTEKKYTYRFSRKMRLPSVQMVWMR